MGSLHIPLGDVPPLPELFAGMPEGLKANIRKGFSILAKLTPDAQISLLGAVVESTGDRNVRDEAALAKALSMSAEEIKLAATALELLNALAYSRSDDIGQILPAMVDAALIAPADKQSLQRIAPAVTQLRPAIKETIAKRTLADAILPSFENFQAVLDIRIGNEEHGGFALPVAVAFIGTDIREHRLWFQLSKADVESMIATLQSLLARFKEAEALIAKWPSFTGGE